MNTYHPVTEDFEDRVNDCIRDEKSGPVNYFAGEENVEATRGRIISVIKKAGGEFLVMDNGKEVRLDTVITLFGRPGPAYDVYASFSASCADAIVGSG